MRLAVFLGTATLALGLIAAAAWAVFQPIGSKDNAYTGGTGDPANPTFTMDQGERPSFSDGGINQHNVTARQNGPDGRALFSTPTLNAGQSATLDGTQFLTAGTYTFFCTIHPTEMQATLIVTGNGTAQPRPSSSIKVTRRSVSQTIKKGLKVKMTPTTTIQGVTLTAKLGKTTIGKKTTTLNAGFNAPVVKLSKAGKSKLRGKSTAKVSVTADIPFGSPVTSKVKLS